jgi:hypothetical protein
VRENERVVRFLYGVRGFGMKIGIFWYFLDGNSVVFGYSGIFNLFPTRISQNIVKLINSVIKNRENKNLTSK